MQIFTDENDDQPPPEYVPGTDADLDSLFDDLQEVIRKEKFEDLCDDTTETAEILTEKFAEVCMSQSAEVLSNNEEQNNLNVEHFPGSKKCLGAVMLLLCLFMIRFKVSDEAMTHLLTIIGILLPDNHKCPTSLYSLRKYLSVYTYMPEIRYYCSFCYAHVEKDMKHCPNHFCNNDLTATGGLSYFVLYSLVKQLQVLFNRKSFTESVRNPTFCRSSKKGVVSDIYDGVLYQNLWQQGFLSDPNNLSFAINTDGETDGDRQIFSKVKKFHCGLFISLSMNCLLKIVN